MDELSDGIIKFVRVSIEIDVEVSELVEDELFSLLVFQEKQSDKVLVAEIHEFFSGEA